jgi:hypothetical protein
MQLPADTNNLSPNGNNAASALKAFQISGDTKEKSDKKFGEKIILQCEHIINSGYFTERNKRFAANRAMAAGRMDLTKFMDFFNINGKTNYVNINWKSIMIVNTIISRLVGRWMTKKEKASVKAVDNVSIKEKKNEIDEAEFLLYNKNEVAALEQDSGVKIVPDEAFVPDDKDHLDLWAEEEQRLPEEILYEKGINNVFNENGWDDVLKRKLLHDSAEVGLIGTETIADRQGKIHVNYCKPENMFYSYSEYPDFRDSSIKGEIVSYKLSQIRNEYPKLTIKELWEIARLSKEWETNNKITFDDGWNNHTFLPFDDWNVDVVRFTLKTLDTDKSLIKTGRDGRMYVDKPKKKIEDVYPGNEYVEKTIWNIYRGVYVRQNKQILEWGLERNMIKPQEYEQMGQAASPYSFYMYQNNKMRNLAVPEKIEEPVEQMILARLKIQQLVAKLRPSGYQYDIDGLQEMDLGNGIVKPLELSKITDQTGNVYFRSRDAEGNRIDNPIKELPNAGSAAQLQTLIEVYNYHLQVLRDEIGINEFAEGQTIKPRVGVQNVQTSMEISFNATDYMRDACVSVMEETADKIACLLHDSVEFGSSAYRKLLEEKDVKERNFKTRIDMLPTTEEITNLDTMVNNAVYSQPDLILYLNPEKIKRIARENVKLAELMFLRGQRRAIQGRMDKAEQDSRMNAENQIASNKSASEGEMALKNMETQGKLTQEQQKFLQAALLKQMEPDVITPPAVQELINIYLEEIKQQKQAEQEARMAQQQEQAAA